MIWWNDPVWGLKYDRQITTLDTIEAYARSGIDFFQPERYWTSHWEQFYVLELSIYQALSAWVSGFTDTVLSASRATNLFFTLLTLPAIFQITATYFCRKTAAYAVVFYSFAPLNLMYQAATLIDVSTTFFATTAYWMLVQYFKGNKSITVFFVFFSRRMLRCNQTIILSTLWGVTYHSFFSTKSVVSAEKNFGLYY